MVENGIINEKWKIIYLDDAGLREGRVWDALGGHDPIPLVTREISRGLVTCRVHRTLKHYHCDLCAEARRRL